MYLRKNKEFELILQDVTEEDFKSPERENIKARQNIHIEDGIDRFINIRYRECPMTVNRNMQGLVDAQTFWRDSRNGRNGLYDTCTSEVELKSPSLQPVYFPTKHINMKQEIPNNDPAPISIMAQYLYDQMMQRSREYIHDVTADVGVITEDDISEISHTDNAVKVKKSFKSKLIGFLKKLSCCHGNDEDMRCG